VLDISWSRCARRERRSAALGVALDITDRSGPSSRVLYQATHDALTGLGNYREFVETLERE